MSVPVDMKIFLKECPVHLFFFPVSKETTVQLTGSQSLISVVMLPSGGGCSLLFLLGKCVLTYSFTELTWVDDPVGGLEVEPETIN